MADEHGEARKLDSGFRVVFLIWGAMVFSLAIYLGVALMLEKYQQIAIFSNLPLQALKYVLFGLSFATLVLVYVLRKYLMKSFVSAGISADSSSGHQHPAVGKYLTVTLISSAMLESIGVYGLVFFLMTKDKVALYQLIIISALGMLHFRPRKDELLHLAEAMKKHQED